MTKEDLQKFCAKPEAMRANIAQPWSAGEHAFATDGRILIAVPRLADVPERDDAPRNIIQHIFNPNTGVFFALPAELPANEIKTCETCKGDMVVTCNFGHDHDCEKCDGSGKIETIKGFACGTQKFNPDLLRLIATLPGVQVANARDEFGAMAFRFEGGEGRVMPMRG
jgi:hypothetical protein